MEVSNSPYRSQTAYTVAILGVILAIASLIVTIFWIILSIITRNRDINDPFWTLIQGQSTGNDTFLSDGNDIYIARNSAAFTLNVGYKSLPITARLFMIDNTASANPITVVGNNTSITDNINKGVVNGRTTGMYIWTSNVTITRLF